MKYLNIQEATALIGKSPRTIRGRVANLSATNKKKYIKRGRKNSLLISEGWLIDTFKKGKNQENDTELYERLLQEKDDRIEGLEKQIEQLNERIKEANLIIFEGQKAKSIEAPKQDKEGNWLSRLLNKKVI